MATEIRVFRADQIGGCVTLIATELGSVMIDYGEELPGSAGGSPEDAEALRRLWETAPPKAVFFTHYHGDHVGRFTEIPDSVPLYMGRVCRKVLVNIHTALESYDRKRKKSSRHTRALEILGPDVNANHDFDGPNAASLRVRTFGDGAAIDLTPLGLEGMRVETIQTDHSAYDAYMFLIRTPDGELILHTGDFRNHGYRGARHDIADTLAARLAGRRVDRLVTEGTMMSRQGERTKTEEELYRDALRLFRERRHVFLAVSSTNPDSVASFQRAAREQGLPVYCYSKYLKAQLDTFAAAEGETDGLYDFSGAMVLRSGWTSARPDGSYLEQERSMRERGFVALIKLNDYYLKLIERFQECRPALVYSLWSGYLDETSRAYIRQWGEFKQAFLSRSDPSDLISLHTGGHADRATLTRLIGAARPRKEIVPIHTENAAGFLGLELDETEASLRIRDTRAALEECLRRSTGAWSVRLPSGIGWSFRYARGGEITMTLSAAAVGLDRRREALDAEADGAIRRVNLNMQQDEAAFEAWALILRAHLGDHISLRLAVREGVLPEEGEAVPQERMWQFGHYFRFLYRVMKFEARYGDWFATDPADKALRKAVDGFRTFLYDPGDRFCGNRVKGGASSAPQSLREKYVEQMFAGPWMDALRRGTPGDVGEIHAQLPVGLFRQRDSTLLRSIRRENRVFTGGASAIDLWGVDGKENTLVLYELKRENKMAGILTELLFYAAYARDLFVGENSWTPAPPVARSGRKGEDRGYGALFESSGHPRRFRGIGAYLLADEYHPLVDGKVLALMNAGTGDAAFGMLRYRLTEDGTCAVQCLNAPAPPEAPRQKARSDGRAPR